jgi:hypothetical protein
MITKHQKTTPANISGPGIRYRKHETNGNRRIDRITAIPKHLATGVGRFVTGRHDHPVLSLFRRGGHLCRRRMREEKSECYYCENYTCDCLNHSCLPARRSVQYHLIHHRHHR